MLATLGSRGWSATTPVVAVVAVVGLTAPGVVLPAILERGLVAVRAAPVSAGAGGGNRP